MGRRVSVTQPLVNKVLLCDRMKNNVKLCEKIVLVFHGSAISRKIFFGFFPLRNGSRKLFD